MPTLPLWRPAAITIVGLGPGDLRDLTLGAWQALSMATHIVLRTERHPCVPALASHFQLESCDLFYERHDQFQDVYAAIVQRVVGLATEVGGVVYAVPGHPWVGEATTALILAQAEAAGLDVRIVGGISFVETVLAAVGVDGMDGLQVADAMLLARQNHPKVEPGQPLLIGQLYAEWLASDLKLTLMNAYPDEHQVILVQAAGTDDATVHRLPLYELDRGDHFDHLTSLFVPP
ncbi:MAG: MazG family protein, partial [Caldilineaceae bacterium]|nr:MazG family protein [Caldilineaceae bacterium]